MTINYFKSFKKLDAAFGEYSSLVQALNLFPGSACPTGVIARCRKPLGTTLSQESLYSYLLEQTRISYQKTKSQYSFEKFDLSHFEHCEWLKSSNVAIRCFFKKPDASVSKRVFVVIEDDSIQDQKIHKFAISNIDLFVHKQGEFKFPIDVIHHDDKIPCISTKAWIEISRYLDGGQRLNIAEIISNQGSFLSEISQRNPHEQNYYQVYKYIHECSNGPLIVKPLKEHFFVMHQTAYKKEIIDSKELRISRGGCIGNLVYTTELVGKNGSVIGGHALGLLERKAIEPKFFHQSLILASVAKTGNTCTNWIDKFGRGTLILSARSSIQSQPCSKEELTIDLACQKKSMQEYESLLPLLRFTYFLSEILKDHQKFSDEHICTMFACFLNIQTSFKSENRNAIFNSMFFEVVKDYILLFQNDPQSLAFRAQSSFNMSLQYQIFFELCPELKRNWSTTMFSPSFSDILDVLKSKGFVSTEAELLHLKRFVLERLAYYCNVGFLEGDTRIPNPDESFSFEDLKKVHPNLAGLLYYYSLKETSIKTEFYKKFSNHLRDEYIRFYKDRNMHFVIKSGVARTEEIGLGLDAVVSFFDLDIQITSFDQACAIPKTAFSFLKIQGVSDKNGFTKRPRTNTPSL